MKDYEEFLRVMFAAARKAQAPLDQPGHGGDEAVPGPQKGARRYRALVCNCSPTRRFGGNSKFIFRRFPDFAPVWGGRRGLIWSSFAAWSLSELVNTEFGQTKKCSAAKALAGLFTRQLLR